MTVASAGWVVSSLTLGAFTQASDLSALRTAGEQTYWVEELAQGLKFPSSMVWLPDGTLLVTEREGGLRRFREGTLDPNPLKGVPARFQNGFNGLTCIVLDPDFPTNQALYLFLTEGTFDQHHTAVYRAQYSASGLENVERIFRSRDEVGGAGNGAARLLMRADKTLLVAVPENNYYKTLAQRLDSHIGKIVRIHRDGSIPADNPFVKNADALPEIFSYGHRVPTGFYQDPETAEIWEVEPGPRGGAELKVLKAGGNYGWAKASWGFDYSGALAASVQFAAGIEDPILVWMPSATPSGITRYRGTIYPAWDGDFFVGHLSGKALERLRIIDRRVVLQEKMLLDLEERIREVRVGPDHHLYLLTDHQNGRLLRLQPGRPRAEQRARIARKLEGASHPKEAYASMQPGDPVKGRQVFLERCSACHSVGAELRGGDVGPDLKGVFGRRAGSKPGFTYSAAMASLPQVWDLISLDLLMMDSARYVPGTLMTAPPMTDPEVRRQIIGFLMQP